MLDGISKMADRLDTALKIYPEKMLVSFNRSGQWRKFKSCSHSLTKTIRTGAKCSLST